MSKAFKSLALALPLLSLAAGSSAFARAKKESWQCVDVSGKEVASVKSKKECAAPNKWTKGGDKNSAMKTSAGAPKQN